MATNSFNNAKLRNVGTSAATLYTAANKVVVLEIDVANVVASQIVVNLFIVSGGNNYNLIKNGAIPIGQTLQQIYGQRLVLLSGEVLKIVSDTASSCDVWASFLEDV
jgi:hypothetical protein